jgi:hypothetical protein
MAKKAKAKPKARKSFAEVAGGVKSPSVFAKTTCTLKVPPTYPNRRIPSTKEESSMFIDLKSTDASDQQIADILMQFENICGVNYRDDLRTVEVIFTTIEARNKYAGNAIGIPGKKPVAMILPREQQRTILYVRMANLPYGDEENIKEVIGGYWEQYGRVLDCAPHKVYGKWLTRRWDLLLELKEGKKLDAPVAFELLGRPIVAAWPSSLPSCLICNTAGHNAKKCPEKIPKAGGASDPVNKVGQTSKVVQEQKQPAEVVQGSTDTQEIQSKAVGKSPDDHQNDQQSGETFTEMIDMEDAPSSEVAGHMDVDEEEAGKAEKTVERTVTPPAQMLSTVVDPDTPTKGKKRMSKVEGLKVVPPGPGIASADVRQYMIKNSVCGNCGKIHRGKACTSHLDDQAIHREVVKRMKKDKEAALKNEAALREKRVTRASSSKMAQKEGDSFVYVPQWCSKCLKNGHLTADCALANCNHCGSDKHVGTHCPQRSKYAFEK